jgi:hypothetical protein
MHAAHVDELVEAHALDALEPVERAQVEQHVVVCPLCRRQLQLAEDTAHMLAFVVPFVAPPRACKCRILEKIAREQFLKRDMVYESREY